MHNRGRARRGGRARLKAHAWNACRLERVSGVRIPPSPPHSLAYLPTFWRSDEIGAWGAIHARWWTRRMPTVAADGKNRPKFSVGDFGMSICEPADILWGRASSGKNARRKQLRRVSLSNVQSLLLRAPEWRQFDSLGHCDGAKVRGLTAFGDRFDDPGRQERQPHYAPNVTVCNMLSPSDFADRPCPARQQIIGPSICTGGRVEHGQIDTCWRCGVTINDEPHLDAAPLYSHRDESSQAKFVRSSGITPSTGWDRQFDGNLEAVLPESDMFDEPGRYGCSFRFGLQALNTGF